MDSSPTFPINRRLAASLCALAVAVAAFPPLSGPPIPPDPCDSPARHLECSTPEGAAAIRIRAAFPPDDWAIASRIADIESGGTLHECVENFRQYRRETGRTWTPERARCDAWRTLPGHRVFGIFQHRLRYWGERTERAYPGGALSPANGWHSTLMAAWLVSEGGGWRHFAPCLESGSEVAFLRCG